MKTGLQVKDFINIGLFAAMYYVIYFATMMLGYFPVLIIGMAVFTGITGGIPFMLFLTRVQRFGMVTVFGVVCGILALISGGGIYPFLTATLFGLLADLVLRSGRYQKRKRGVLAYGIFCLWSAGFGIRTFVVTNQAYIASMRASYGEEYATSVLNLMPGATFWLSILLAVAGGLVGGVIGQKVLRSHFEKAGIA